MSRLRRAAAAAAGLPAAEGLDVAVLARALDIVCGPGLYNDPLPTAEAVAATYAEYLALAAPNRAEREPCPACKGRRWANDENWTPNDPRTWDGSRSHGDGLIPCGFCNEGGWDTPDYEPEAAADRAERGLPPHTRLILADEDLLEVFGTRTERGERITAEWGEPSPEGWYTPTFTAHADDRIGELDEAWRQAEAVLPDGWRITQMQYLGEPVRRDQYHVMAERFGAAGSETASGPTLAAALHALAARLAADPQSPTGEGS